MPPQPSKETRTEARNNRTIFLASVSLSEELEKVDKEVDDVQIESDACQDVVFRFQFRHQHVQVDDYEEAEERRTRQVNHKVEGRGDKHQLQL